MAAKHQKFSWDHPVIVMFVLIAVVAAMSLAAEVLKPLALSVLLSFALSPLARMLEKRGVPRAPAVILTVFLTLGTLGGIAYAVYGQLEQIAGDMPKYEKQILAKIDNLKLGEPNKFQGLQKVTDDVAEKINQDKKGFPDIQSVQIVSQPDFRKRLESSVGPYLEMAGVGAFVLILVLFMLMNREDLSDRVVQLFGRRRVTLTTRTMDEVGQRISRYLAMFATVNSTFGLIVGLGLWAIGIKYAILWGFLAAALRFIPYIGPGTAFALPLIFSIVTAEKGSWQPIEVAALFGILEVAANSFLEPIIYGKTTGVSALGLLVAAMFWTWLWGPLGLLLSTPMTVCLAVIGKYVPSLGFFAILLGEEAELPQDVRYYQRLLALDQDGAAEIVESGLKGHPRAEVYDTIIIPALSRAERDYSRDELDDREQAFIRRVVGDTINELEGTPDITLTAAAGLSPALDGSAKKTIKIAGIAANDASDALVLKMLEQLLTPSGCAMEIITDTESPLRVAEHLASAMPDLVVLSHLPPLGLTPARYLVRRLRARFKDLPIIVGRWAEAGASADAVKGLTEVGASQVALSLVEAREKILAIVGSKQAEQKEKEKPKAPALV